MSTPHAVWQIVFDPLQELKAEPVSTPWTERRTSFVNKLGFTAPAITELLRQLDEMTDAERNSFLSTSEVDSLAYELLELYAPPADDVSDSEDELLDQPEDEQLPVQADSTGWWAYLAANGAAWDGTEVSWEVFRNWFVYNANESGFGDQASTLLDYLGTLPVAQRITEFAGYGVVIQPVQAPKGHDKDRKRPRDEPAQADPAKTGGEKARAQDGDENDDGAPPKKVPRRSTRQAGQLEKAGPANLTVTSKYSGAKTQELGKKQNFGFHQVVVLTRPKGVSASVTTLYTLIQEVKDAFEHQIPDQSKDLGEFEVDNPEKSVVTVSTDAIQMVDDPGFSTTSAILPGNWLNSYEIHFQWKVTRKEDGRVWTSPTVKHWLTSPYDNGKDQQVDFEVDDDCSWEVVF